MTTVASLLDLMPALMVAIDSLKVRIPPCECDACVVIRNRVKKAITDLEQGTLESRTLSLHIDTFLNRLRALATMCDESPQPECYLKAQEIIDRVLWEFDPMDIDFANLPA